ncbi:hypothetical protein AB0I85_22055 [Micromonospora echinofusca]|uniref:hypothetical protein n=1 Tax=Micromonospora echinofusca TaxID=47858 RepID=UPI002020BB32|nr:hypothetical protein [Micromonospora sp. MSM11]MCL7459011.1 hypothetical protein [Micromonospora sp. MSM11]
MQDHHRMLADLLFGHLAHEITQDTLLAYSVRWGIELYDNAEQTMTLMQLQQMYQATRVPQLTTTIEEPEIAAALRALRRRMGNDMAQLEADVAEVRSPIVAVLTSGASLDTPADRVVALDALLTRSLRTEEEQDWSPSVLFINLQPNDDGFLNELAGGHDNVAVEALRSPEDVAAVARTVTAMVRQSVAHGVSRLRYAQWVVADRDLTLGRHYGTTAESNLVEIVAATALQALEPLVYRRFRNTEDADDHPFAPLLNLVSLRNSPVPPGRIDHLADRMLWPLRLVVGEDPVTPVGFVAPDVRPLFVDDEDGERVPRAMSALHLDGTASPAQPDDVPAADGVLRARLCAALADAVDLAHSYGVVLGERALESALYTVRPAPAVLLADCDAVRLRDPAVPHWQVPDLTWLARFVDRCVTHPAAGSGQDSPVLDATGQALLRRARSNVPDQLPRASEWRDFLAVRAVELQGPPVLEQVQAGPIAVPVGSPVTVRWRSRYADQVIITGPDGTRCSAGRGDLDDGCAQLIATRPGCFEVTATNQLGDDTARTGWVHAFELPRLTELPVPAPPVDPAVWRADELRVLLDRIQSRLRVDPAQAFPSVVPFDPAAPVAAERRGASAMFRRRRSLQTVMQNATFPINLTRWFTACPERPEHRRPRWLRKLWG